MIDIKSKREIEALRRSADLVSRTLAEVGRHVQPGVTPTELDEVAEEFIRFHDAEPAFKGKRNGEHVFPATLCTSKNDEVVHGIPNDEALKEGDVISVDCGVILDGYVGDSAYTFAVGALADSDVRLCRTTYEALLAGIEQATSGNRTGDIGHAVETRCHDYGVVQDLCGHGVGRTVWEDPQIPNYGTPGQGKKLRSGLVICIEPMVNIGMAEVTTDDDGWTVRTADGSTSAHYEHMVVVNEDGPEVISSFDYIEEVVDAPYLQQEVLAE